VSSPFHSPSSSRIRATAQPTGITLDAGHARDITLMLPGVHAVLDQLRLDGTQPQTTGAADAVLRESGSPYNLPALISALGDVINQLTRAIRHATATSAHQGPTTLPASDPSVRPLTLCFKAS
jgi:hypothetical protein